MSSNNGVRNRLIIVLGMHRSGTSAITKSLELLGVSLGNNLFPARDDNPKGFWEERECIEINDSLLAHLGSAADRLSLAWDEIPADPHVCELKIRAIQLISRKFSENNSIWGFKDPRTCRLLSFWNQVCIAAECDVAFVVAVRNPASVVASLARRDDIPAEKAYYLWLQHVLPPLYSIQEAPRVVVDYDELLANPYSQLVRISTKLGLPLPARHSPLVKDYESNFLEDGLRHGRFTEADLALDRRAPAMVSTTYKLLFRLATDQETLESSKSRGAINELNAQLNGMAPIFDFIKVIECNLISLRQTVSNRDAQLAERDASINAIYASYSWHLTKPLRFFMRAARKIKLVATGNS